MTTVQLLQEVLFDLCGKPSAFCPSTVHGFTSIASMLRLCLKPQTG